MRDFKRQKESCSLPFGSIDIPVSLENRHFFTIGIPGTGKSQMLRHILKKLREREEKCVIFDYKGEFFSEFYDPDFDLLFNPLDQRSVGWNLFNEFERYTDIEALAASLIPPTISSDDPFWRDAARGVFTGILQHLHQTNRRTNADLWRMLTMDGAEILDRLKVTRGGEAGARYLAQDKRSSRQADSVLATMMQYTKAFEFMSSSHGGFKITDWLRDPVKGCIYITNYEDIEDTLRPLLSLFIDLLSRKLLSMPDDLNRRIFFLLDEFGSLQRLPSIVNLLTRGRSKGASVFLGVQDNGQISKVYKPETLETIENSCGNRVTFAVSGKTAEREARNNIGEVEVASFTKAINLGGKKGGISFSEKRQRELVILPSELAKLPDLTAIVKLRGYDFTVSKWNWEASTHNHPRFLIKDGFSLDFSNPVLSRMIYLPPPQPEDEERFTSNVKDTVKIEIID